MGKRGPKRNVEHSCGKMPPSAFVLQNDGGVWIADCEGVDAFTASGAEGINFCPWCGVQLVVKAEVKLG